VRAKANQVFGVRLAVAGSRADDFRAAVCWSSRRDTSLVQSQLARRRATRGRRQPSIDDARDPLRREAVTVTVARRPLPKPKGASPFLSDLTEQASRSLDVLHAIGARAPEVLGDLAGRVVPALDGLAAAIEVAVSSAGDDADIYVAARHPERWRDTHREPILAAIKAADRVYQTLDMEQAADETKALALRPAVTGIDAVARSLADAEVRGILRSMDPAVAMAEVTAMARGGTHANVLAAVRESPWGTLPAPLMAPEFRAKLDREIVERVVGYQSPTASGIAFLASALQEGRRIARHGVQQ